MSEANCTGCGSALSNPVKLGCAKTVAQWPYSTFHRLIELGIYPVDWASVGDFPSYGE